VPSLVVDASVAIKWLNPSEALADKANALYADYAQGHCSLLVPAFWEYEVANGMNKAVARGDLTEQEGQAALALLFAVQVHKTSLPTPQQSYALARRYRRSVYDSWYLALAETAGCAFWTADAKLYNAVHAQLTFVQWLGDYGGEADSTRA
jgi:predicted nucleic acid-binding protein